MAPRRPRPAPAPPPAPGAVRCTTCNQRVEVTPTGVFVEHRMRDGAALCGMSGHVPACAHCGRPSAFGTVVPELRVCGPCNDAVALRLSIQRCPNPKCTGGQVLCPTHRADIATGRKCRICKDYDGAKVCGVCNGANVVYRPREVEPEEVAP